MKHADSIMYKTTPYIKYEAIWEKSFGNSVWNLLVTGKCDYRCHFDLTF